MTNISIRKWWIAGYVNDRVNIKKVLDENNLSVIKEYVSETKFKVLCDNEIGIGNAVGQIFIVEVDKEKVDEVILLRWLFLAGAFEVIPGYEGGE